MNVQIYNNIEKNGLDILTKNGIKASKNEVNPIGIILRSHKLTKEPETIINNPNILAIARAGAGTNNIPADQCTKQGVAVFNTPGANANAVAELVIASILASARNIFPAKEALYSVENKTNIALTAEEIKKNFVGTEIAGKTLGIIGLGAIGVLVSQLATGLKMKVIGYDPYLSTENALKTPSNVKVVNNIGELLAWSEYITLHIPATPSTEQMINGKFLSQVREGAKIFNFSRGELISIPDIIKSLEGNKISGYITDFADERLIPYDKVLMLPHLGASTPQAEEACAVMACEQLKNYLEKGEIVNSVNFPDVKLSSNWKTRILVIYKDQPNMISNVTSLFGGIGINIEELTDKRKGENACLLMGFNQTIPAEIIEKIENTKGVLKVRNINLT